MTPRTSLWMQVSGVFGTPVAQAHHLTRQHCNYVIRGVEGPFSCMTFFETSDTLCKYIRNFHNFAADLPTNAPASCSASHVRDCLRVLGVNAQFKQPQLILYKMCTFARRAEFVGIFCLFVGWLVGGLVGWLVGLLVCFLACLFPNATSSNVGHVY